MRVLIAVIAIAFMMLPAYAQMGMGKGRTRQDNAKQDTTVKADESAYKNASKSVPAPREKPDPWQSMR